MKKIFSTRYTPAAFNISMLLLRIISGVLIINHGISKLVDYAGIKDKFLNFLGLGSSFSLSLTIFAEFFCGILIVLGLFTRLAAIPLIVVMCVVVFKVTGADFFGKSEIATLYLGAFLTLLIVGPGRASIDGMISK